MKAILDASVAISHVHPEAPSPAVRRWLTEWVATGGSFVVPRHFWLEIVNSLGIRHRYSGAAMLEAIHALRQLPIETIDLDEPAVVLVIDIVERHRLTAYDAQYVALSEQVVAPIVTVDRAIARAVGTRAIDPLAPAHRLSETRAPYGEPARVTWPDYSGAAAYLSSLRAQVKRTQERLAMGRGTGASVD